MIGIVLSGLDQAIEIDGDTFSNVMASHDFLKDQEIADVLTYVRNSFVNKASAVSPAEVAAVRATKKNSIIKLSLVLYKRNEKVLFIDRDGTIIKEAPPTYQIDSFDKLEFYPSVFRYLGRIAAELDYELVMVTNQDGLGTEMYREEDFDRIHHFVIKSFAAEGIVFAAEHIDRSFPGDHLPTRKPGTGMLTRYMNSDDYDLANSFVIGDRDHGRPTGKKPRL